MSRPYLIQGGPILSQESVDLGDQVALRQRLGVPDMTGAVILKAPNWIWKETSSVVVTGHQVRSEEEIIGWYHSLDILQSDGKLSVLELTHVHFTDILSGADDHWQILLPGSGDLLTSGAVG